jgi:putative hydrolases of HD superfamily
MTLERSPLALTRLERQLAFVIEIDKLKQVLRQTRLMDGTRRENDAEHCWHLAMMALVLSEHAAPDVDLARVLKMLLIHDIVEIDAGDTFIYATDDATSRQAEREAQAADRLFGLLPPDQAAELRSLW